VSVHVSAARARLSGACGCDCRERPETRNTSVHVAVSKLCRTSENSQLTCSAALSRNENPWLLSASLLEHPDSGVCNVGVV